MKKAQSISINTIIIAAIGLAVLVVLFAIFTGRLGSFSQGVAQTDTCAQKCSALSLRSAGSGILRGACQGTEIGGRYSDITGEGSVCCCTQ